MTKKLFLLARDQNNQQGVTLLLAILVLSSMLAISFSLAAILLIETRASGDLLKTEPALYAAQAVTEEALFKLKRNYQPTGVYYTTGINNIVLSAPIESKEDNPSQTDKVAWDSSSCNITPNRYPIYNLDNPNGDPGLRDVYNNPIPAGGYGKIEVTMLDTGLTSTNLRVFLCKIDLANGSTCSDCGTGNIWVSSPTGDSINTVISPYNSWSKTLDKDYQYELRLVNAGGVGPIYVNIKSYGVETPSGSGLYPGKGLPFFAETSVNIEASQGGVTRTVRVKVPSN